MRSLTKEEKIEGYQFAYDEIKSRDPKRRDLYVCDQLFEYILRKKLDDTAISLSEEIKRHFPEFLEHKPESTYLGGSWWPMSAYGKKKRLEVLSKIISDLR